jgi:hypothetical protein
VTAAEPISVMLLVVKELEALGIPYFIGGSLASAIHGVFRATADVDIVADMRLQHAEPLTQALEPAFYVQADDIRDAIRGRSSFNLIHFETMFKVDIFVFKGRPFDKAQFERRASQIVVTDSEHAAYFASAEDTVLAKLEWYRMGGEVSDRQWNDILGILKAQAATLDIAYLRRWVSSLGVADLLGRAFKDAAL